MNEVKYSYVKVPQGPEVKLSPAENTAFKIIENLEEARSRQELNARAENNARRLDRYKCKYSRERQQRIFKAIDVAMWSALAIGLLALAVMM